MATNKNTGVTEIKVEGEVTPMAKKPAEPETVSRVQFEQLQESYRKKCIEYDKLLEAYRSLAIRYTADGDAARQFIKTASLGINLLFPEDKKGV